MRFIKILMTFFRLIFGTVYILSGFFKFVDPVGTGLIVEEYLQVMHLGFLRWGALPCGIILSALEFLIGVSVLAGIRIKIGSFLGLIINSFFTILTLIIAILDVMKECGCFGEVIHLTMWETFFKNVILTVCIIPVFIYRNKFKNVAPKTAEWVLLAFYAVSALSVPIYSLINLPVAEFGNFKVGTNLSVKLTEQSNSSRFKTRLIYEKNGKREYFDLENLPDDSWTYIDSESHFEGNERELLFDMTIMDMDGQLIAEDMVGSEKPVFLFVAYRPEKLSGEYWERLAHSVDSLFSAGCIPYVLAPSYDETMVSAIDKYPILSKTAAFGDYKTLISIVRSNGGAVYLRDGIVIRKWPKRRFDVSVIKSVLSKDVEGLTASECISQHIFCEVSILLIFIIIIVFRYVCGILYGKTNGYIGRKDKRERA